MVAEAPTSRRLGLPDLGLGVGLRSQHFPFLMGPYREREDVRVAWFEVISENFMGNRGYARHVLDRLRQDHPVVMHGVSLSIGSTAPLDEAYLRSLADLAQELEPAWVSDHLCWTGLAGRNSHDLLPMPLTEEALDHVADRVHRVQERLGRPLILENPSTYLELAASQIPEHEFLNALCARTGCGLLLDVNNVFVSATNHGRDPHDFIEGIDASRVVQLHLAGPTDTGDLLVDTHDRPVPDPVWALYRRAQERTGGVAALLEWDANIPDFPDLVAELHKARDPDARGTPVAQRPWALSTPVHHQLAAIADRAPIVVQGPATASPTAHAPAVAPTPTRHWDLPTTQAWMLTVLTSRGGLPEKLARATQAHGPTAEDIVRNGVGASVHRRLDTYAGGYALRLVLCLETEFPALRQYLGGPLFETFAKAYVVTQPPSSPSLFDLGAGFVDFLDETTPDDPRMSLAQRHLLALPAAIGRLERAAVDVSLAPAPPRTPDLTAIDLVRPDLVLQAPATLRLLRLPFPLGFMQALERGEAVPPPAPVDQPAAIRRVGWRVGRLALEPWQHAVLTELSEPTTVSQLVDEAPDPGARLAQLMTWLPAATTLGLVTVAPHPDRSTP